MHQEDEIKTVKRFLLFTKSPEWNKSEKVTQCNQNKVLK